MKGRDMRRVLAGFAAAAVSVAACSGGVSNAQVPSTKVWLDQTRHSEAVTASNLLGLEMVLADPEAANAVASPISLTIALAMLAEGATGDGVAQLDTLLGLTGTDRTEAYSALTTALGAYQSEEFSLEALPEEAFLRVANNLTAMEGFDITPEFTEQLEAYFGAPLGFADFAAPSGKKILDDWVYENTAGLIEKSAIEPDANTRLVLQNALLFAAPWAVPFEADATTTSPFILPSGATVDTPMMNMAEQFLYGERDGYRVAVLPYVGEFMAWVILPPEGEEPDPESVSKAMDSVENVRLLELSLPSFDLAAKADLVPFLRDHGVTAIFDDPTSLTGIADASLVVDAVAQQARLIVDEEGTIGAAVTEIAMDESSGVWGEPVEFRVDRPFIFVVRHHPTQTDIFTAYVTDPSAAE